MYATGLSAVAAAPEACNQPINITLPCIGSSILCIINVFCIAGVLATTDIRQACAGVDYVIMLGGVVRKPNMDRREVMSRNVSIYRDQAEALSSYAATNVKVAAAWAHARCSLAVEMSHVHTLLY